jgi:hypothetical protein
MRAVASEQDRATPPGFHYHVEAVFALAGNDQRDTTCLCVLLQAVFGVSVPRQRRSGSVYEHPAEIAARLTRQDATPLYSSSVTGSCQSVPPSVPIAGVMAR